MTQEKVGKYITQEQEADYITYKKVGE